jgi:hypothetical protein
MDLCIPRDGAYVVTRLADDRTGVAQSPIGGKRVLEEIRQNGSISQTGGYTIASSPYRKRDLSLLN